MICALYFRVATINTKTSSSILFGEKELSEVLLDASKELIDDAKISCADLVFKEICLEILARAKHVLTNTEFETLKEYATERIQEKTQIEISTQLEAKTIR